MGIELLRGHVAQLDNMFINNWKRNLFTYGITVRLVGFELLVVRELHVNGAPAQLGDAAAKVCDHGHGRYLLRHLKESLRQGKNDK